MNRLVTSLVILIIVASGIGLYQLKYKTQRLQQEVRALEAEMVADQAAIRVLEAEWTYLTRPDRVAALTKRYLALVPTEGQQVGLTPDILEQRVDEDAVLAQVDDFKASAVVLARAERSRERPPVFDSRPDTVVAAQDPLSTGSPVNAVARRDVEHSTPPGEVAADATGRRDSEELFERLRVVLMEGGND